MSWCSQDWEYLTDEMYAIERHEEMKITFQRWENEQRILAKLRKPAIIKVLKPTKHEIKHYASKVRRANKKRL